MVDLVRCHRCGRDVDERRAHVVQAVPVPGRGYVDVTVCNDTRSCDLSRRNGRRPGPVVTPGQVR